MVLNYNLIHFQPHLNLYEGIVFQLIGDDGKIKASSQKAEDMMS